MVPATGIEPAQVGVKARYPPLGDTGMVLHQRLELCYSVLSERFRPPDEPWSLVDLARIERATFTVSWCCDYLCATGPFRKMVVPGALESPACRFSDGRSPI